jgi:hypothetical protein
VTSETSDPETEEIWIPEKFEFEPPKVLIEPAKIRVRLSPQNDLFHIRLFRIFFPVCLSVLCYSEHLITIEKLFFSSKITNLTQIKTIGS